MDFIFKQNNPKLTPSEIYFDKNAILQNSRLRKEKYFNYEKYANEMYTYKRTIQYDN